MKKIIAHLLLVILAISVLFAYSVHAAALTVPTIAVSDITCNPGDNIDLSVLLENNPGIMYLSVTPKCYDEDGEESDYVTISSVENGALFSLEKGKNLVFDSDSNVTDNDVLCTLHIDISADAPLGDYTVEFVLRECYNSSEQDVELETIAGIITVEKPHIPAPAVKENIVKATCKATGSYDEVVYCSDCDEELSRKGVVVPKTGHTEVTVKGKAATCTATGLTDGKKCSVCATVLTAQKTIAKKGHSYETKTTKATMTKNGKNVKRCEDCDYVASTTTIYAAKTVKLSKTTYTYTGKTIKPTIVIKDSKGKTISSAYYTISGTKSAKKIGTHKIKVTFKGRYSGTKTLKYTIEPKKVSSLSLKSSTKKKITVSWKKDTSVSGYEIVYATNSKFTKGKKTVKITSSGTTKKTISKLTSKKTYYVKMRAYKTVNGDKYYSDWSSTKKLKVK